MKLTPTLCAKLRTTVSKGKFAIVSEDGKATVFAIAGYHANAKKGGFAILDTSPHWLFAEAVGQYQALELPDVEIAISTARGDIQFTVPAPAAGSIAIVENQPLLAVRSAEHRVGYLDLVSGELADVNLANAVWCTRWRAGHRHPHGIEEIFRFPPAP